MYIITKGLLTDLSLILSSECMESSFNKRAPNLQRYAKLCNKYFGRGITAIKYFTTTTEYAQKVSSGFFEIQDVISSVQTFCYNTAKEMRLLHD